MNCTWNMAKITFKINPLTKHASHVYDIILSVPWGGKGVVVNVRLSQRTLPGRIIPLMVKLIPSITQDGSAEQRIQRTITSFS